MYSRILVPIDGSASAIGGFDEAIRLAQQTCATLRVVRVIDQLSHVTGFESCSAYPGYTVPHLRERGEWLLASASRRAARQGVVVESKLYETGGAHLADVVLDDAHAWGADLICMSTHGRHGMDRFLLGNEAEEIARRASVPLLLVRETTPAGNAAPAADPAVDLQRDALLSAPVTA